MFMLKWGLHPYFKEHAWQTRETHLKGLLPRPHYR
jgi:hypothetical protein